MPKPSLHNQAILTAAALTTLAREMELTLMGGSLGDLAGLKNRWARIIRAEVAALTEAAIEEPARGGGRRSATIKHGRQYNRLLTSARSAAPSPALPGCGAACRVSKGVPMSDLSLFFFSLAVFAVTLWLMNRRRKK